MARVSIKQKAKNLYADVKKSAKSFVQPRVISPVPEPYKQPLSQRVLYKASNVTRGAVNTAQKYSQTPTGKRIAQSPGGKIIQGAYNAFSPSAKMYGEAIGSGIQSRIADYPAQDTLHSSTAQLYRKAAQLESGGNRAGASRLRNTARMTSGFAYNDAQKTSEEAVRQSKRAGVASVGLGLTATGGRYLTPTNTAIAGFLGGGINKAFGGSFYEGFGGGIGAAPATQGLLRFSDPVTQRLTNKLLGQPLLNGTGFNSQAARQLVGRAFSGLTNLGEDEVLNKASGFTSNKAQKTTSFVLGAALSPAANAQFMQFAKNAPEAEGAREVGRYIKNKAGKLFDTQTGRWVASTADKLKQSVQMFASNKEFDPNRPTKIIKNPKNENQFIRVYSDTGEPIGHTVKELGFKLDKANSEGNAQPQPLGTSQYLEELKSSQTKAKSGARVGIKQKAKSFIADFKEKIVDSSSPFEDAISNAEKQGKFQVRPTQDPRLQVDRVLRSKTLASQYVEDNGLSKTIQDVPDIDALDQYMIAKQAKAVEAQGKKTGRDLVRDEQLVNDLSAEYEPYAQQVNQYSRKLKSYMVETGLISKELSDQLDRQYPDYVPMQRIFDEVERADMSQSVNPRGVASLSKQSVVQRLEGSEREIASPIESLLLKTQDAFNQGERNKAGRMVAQMANMPGFEGLIRELPPGESAAHTISYLDGGVKRTFETTPEIAAAAKNLNSESLGFLGKIVSASTRLVQMGATGYNLPFVVRNVLKDQVTSFVNSNKAASTSLLNPQNFIRSLFSALKHDDLYSEVVRNAAGGTSFDIARQAPDLSVARIRAGKSAGSKVKYTARNPKELFRALEDIIGRSEELGRIQSYRGTKQALLKEGRTSEDAALLAAKAARENTANFARKGSWGKVLNVLIPYFNAGIQGGRALTRSFQKNPAGTSFKVASTIFLPVAAATAWNLSDPERKKIYDDIPDWEKDSNIVIIPPNVSQDDRGRYNVIKIPLPPGLSNLSALVRKPMEDASGLDPVSFTDLAANVTTALGGVDVTSPSRLLSSTVPQTLKVPLEFALNKNLYTGKDIVPYFSQGKPAEEQVYPWTSGTARKIGGVFNVSPLKVENAVGTSAAGVGKQALNALDTALYKSGEIPKEQIGGESIPDNIVRSFTKASGGETKKEEDLLIKQKNDTKKQIIDAFLANDKEKARELYKQYGERITSKDVTSRQKEYTKKLVEAYLDGDIDTAKGIQKQYNPPVKNSDVTSVAKSRAVALIKRYKQTQNKDYLLQAKDLTEKYKLSIKNSDIQ